MLSVSWIISGGKELAFMDSLQAELLRTGWKNSVSFKGTVGMSGGLRYDWLALSWRTDSQRESTFSAV